jgi:glucokinase
MASKNGKMKRSYTLGIDLGGTKILTAVVDDKGKVVAAIKALTRAQEGAEAVLERIKQTMDKVIAKAKLAKKDIAGIGIGVPGVIDVKRGVIIKITNIPGMERVPMAKILREWLGHVALVVLSNDVRVATWGEYLHGAGKGYKHLVTVWVGTGIGGGIILNGKLWEGSRGNAGEVGHMITLADGPLALGAGIRGGIEALASRTSIERDLRKALMDGRDSILPKLLKDNGDAMKSGVLAEAVGRKDEVTIETLERAAHYLGLHAASLINCLDPELIIYGGGLMEKLGDWMVKRIAKTAKQHAINKANLDQIKLAPSALGDYAGVVGAAMLARTEHV